jgi:hypothetical protein
MNVISLDVFPGIQQTKLLEQICALPNLAGVVLRTYGTGNTSTNKEFLSQIREATAKGIVLLNVTQCSRGGVEMGLYETSAVLLDCGVCSGEDITAEAALCKMMVLLGDKKEREKLSDEEVLSALQTAWAGEQTHSLNVTKILQSGEIKSGEAKRKCGINPTIVTLDPDEFSKALLRFRGARVFAPVAAELSNLPGPAVIRVWVDVLEDEDVPETSPKFAGRFPKQQCAEAKTTIFDITKAAKKNFRAKKKFSFTVALEDIGAGFSWESVELVLYATSG